MHNIYSNLEYLKLQPIFTKLMTIKLGFYITKTLRLVFRVVGFPQILHFAIVFLHITQHFVKVLFRKKKKLKKYFSFSKHSYHVVFVVFILVEIVLVNFRF